MDTRRPPYVAAPPPSHTQPPPAHDPRHHHHPPSHPTPYPPPPPPHYAQQPPRGPPPPQAQYQHPPSGPPPQHHQQQQHPPPQPYPGAPNLPPPQGHSLPPIVPAAHAQPATSAEQPNLPSIRHPSGGPPPHDQREGGPPEYHYPYNHNRSGHATPAPVNRSYSHDSGPQRSPATPAGPGPGSYPPSAGPDGAPPPPGPPHQMDHGAHHGYPPNGNLPHGLPPPQAPHQHHEQYPPPQPTPMMDSHYPQYPPPPSQPPMYGGGPYNGPASGNLYGTKRKQMRATQACEQCRQRKQKCDEGSPCSFCKENSLSCQYRDTPPAKTDKNMEKLLHYMEAHSNGLQELTSKIDSFEQRLRRVEQSAQQTNTSPDANAWREHAPTEDREPPERELPERKHELRDHRTAPHKLLLLWPTVSRLLQRANVEHNDGYVMEAEDRGVLRLWTRGEGIDEYDGTQPGGPASPARSDESGEAAAATPHADGLWGHGFPTTPNSEARRSEPYGAGGLKSNGEVDLDATTINSLYDSYMRHIHIMHPFLDKRRLRRMFDNFIKRYSTGRPRAAFAVGMTNYDSDQRPLKRQRSNGSTANIGPGSDGEPRPREQTERSPGNAVIYLVLALGKICMHKEPLPAIVADSKLQANSVISHQISGTRGLAASSPVSANIKPSPMSPKSTPTTQPTPPSEAGMRLNESRSRRSSTDGSPSANLGPRNMDVIPGIAYYAKAAEILGDQGDGNDLVHAQMFLLAGLYKGQLARVKESMSWITMAGRAIQILLDRYKLYNSNYWTAYGDVRSQLENAQSRIKDTRQSLIVLASWTCLQLESDILAELKLPGSGIQDVENLLLMPHKSKEEESYGGLDPDGRREDYDNILIYYSAQLYLRRRLNQVHREMYGPESLSQPLAQVQEMLLGHEHILTQWREKLPPKLQWFDDEQPASDILAARLRAKYYGARYVINRPFLDYALHIMPGLTEGSPMEKVARDGHGNPRDKADIHLFRAIQGLGESTVWQAARRCVDAAMHSTIAFDGVPDRLIITNIHGTAHAQFGNMLVLSATYNSGHLTPIVDTDLFRSRLQRTIGFLRKLAPISPTCTADCGILEKLNNLLFPASSAHYEVYKDEGVEPMSATNSFGGHST